MTQRIGGAPPRKALLVTIAALLIAGIAISTYLAWHHEAAVYGSGASLNCPRSDTVNCDLVNSSEYSELFGTPLSVYGAAVYVALLIAVVTSRRHRQMLRYAFALALLSVAVSMALFLISKLDIGFICLWCVSLYAINALLAVLVPFAARERPSAMIADALQALTRWPFAARLFAAICVVSLVVSVGAGRAYRSTFPAPEAEQRPTKENPADSSSTFSLPGSLYSLALKKGATPALFNFQERIGRGRAIALFFWAPGDALSEGELINTAAFVRSEAPNVDLYAVAGRRADLKVEAAQEAFLMLGISDAVPLLIDDAFAVSKALDVSDVPNILLIDQSGRVIVKKLKALEHAPSRASPTVTGEQMLRKLAAGEGVDPVTKAAPYYPGSELFGRCAPSFKLSEFLTGKERKFAGRSTRGKPTLLMFWSSTCKHCQKEIPALIAHHAEHEDEYDVVTVTQIRKDKADGSFSHREATKRYIEQTKITWPVLEDADGFVNELFKVVSTPTTFLIAGNGEVVDAWYFVHPDPSSAVETALTQLNAVSGTCKAREKPLRPSLSLSMTAPDGTEVDLPGIIDQPTIVHLWATWCVPCLKELPAFLKLKDRIEPDGAKVIFLSVDDEQAADAIAAFQQKHGFRFPSHRAPRAGLADRVDLAYSVPRTFLLNADGDVVDIRYGDQPWDDPVFERRVRSRLQVSP